jgi:pyrroline-5-carboxylate reductase
MPAAASPSALPADCTVAFVGGGNMAASLIGGLLAAGHPTAHIRVAQRNAERGAALAQRFGIDVVREPAPAAHGARLVVLAVKPQQMAEAVRELDFLDETQTVLSVAAGLRVATLRAWLPRPALVRSMPNTPALFRAGISGLYASPETSAAARALADALLSCCGATCWLQREEQMDALTALSGCGPAYFFWLTEALREAGAALGLDAASAARLAQETFLGAAAMAQGSDEDVATLRMQVTSKGGATAAALALIEGAGTRRIFIDALAAAATRARELGNELERSAQPAHA